MLLSLGQNLQLLRSVLQRILEKRLMVRLGLGLA